MSPHGQNDPLSLDVVREVTHFCVNESIDSLICACAYCQARNSSRCLILENLAITGKIDGKTGVGKEKSIMDIGFEGLA